MNIKGLLGSIALIVMISISVYGCSKNEVRVIPANSDENIVSEDGNETAGNISDQLKEAKHYMKYINAEDYVTLGDYKGIEIEGDVPTVTEEEIDNNVNYYLASPSNIIEVNDRAAKEGDTVNIDFEGKLDGVPFDGGTAQGYDLKIGSGKFIKGFEEKLIGAKKGETRDLELTFPDDYGSADLVGKEVVFTVKVNKISEPNKTQVDDEFVESLAIPEVKNVAEFRAYIEKKILEEKNINYNNNIKLRAVEIITMNSIIKSPNEELLAGYRLAIENSLKAQAQVYGMEVKDYVANFFGIAEEALEGEIANAAVNTMNQTLVSQVIANKENLNVTDEDIEVELEARYQAEGYESVEDYRNNVDIEELRDMMMVRKVTDFVVDNAKMVPVK